MKALFLALVMVLTVGLFGASLDTASAAKGGNPGKPPTATSTVTPTPTPTVSPTPTPSPTPSPTPTPTPTPTATPTGNVWTSPEGVQIDIQTTEGGWTHQKIYNLLLANARDLNKIGPGLKIIVQNVNPTLGTMGADSVNGVYTSFHATVQLDARCCSTFTNHPDDILTHEYGHVWYNYFLWIKWQGNENIYNSKRWTNSDGSLTLATDSRTGSSYIWTPDEIVADDYRLLFGSSLAISQRPVSLNQQIIDPRNQPGLKDWFISTYSS